MTKPNHQHNLDSLLAATYMVTASVLQMLFSNWFRRHLRTNLYKTWHDMTWRVLVGNRTEIFSVLASNKFVVQKLPVLTTSQLSGNFEGQYLRRGTWKWQLGNGIGNYEGYPTSSQNFMNFGPLTGKNETIVFTHPLLGGGRHHVGLPLCVPIFLVNL